MNEIVVKPQEEITMERQEMSVKDISDRFRKMRELMKAEMEQNIDYGVIPGTKSKPTLLKPGAEKLAVLFMLGAREPIIKQEWNDNHLTVTVSVTLFHIPSGRDVGTGVGMCSTKEKKYATKYGKPNPDLPDLWNTVLKMAVKRAKVDATLSATGASSIFTQDVEEETDSYASSKNQGHRMTQDRVQHTQTIQTSSDTKEAWKRFSDALEAKGLDRESGKMFVSERFPGVDMISLSVDQVDGLIAQLGEV